MLTHIHSILFGTLRRQLIFAVAVVHAVMMSLFVWDLTTRQQDMLLEQQASLAKSLAQSVATSSSVWLAARDLAGLQEIIEAQRRYPELSFAMVLDRKGRILAHNESIRRGQYVNTLPERPELSVMSRSRVLVDVASPVMLAGNHIGWVRVGIGQLGSSARLERLTQDGLFYALAAILIGGVMAAMLANRLTLRLNAIRKVADDVEAGDHTPRVEMAGVDEAAQLGLRFNHMLDTLEVREKALLSSQLAARASEERLHDVMKITGVGIWDWDLASDVVQHNIGWCELLGLGEEFLSHPLDAFAKHLHEADRAAVMARIQSCLAGSGPYRSEHRMLRADGQIIWVQDHGDVVARDSEGKPARMLGSITDITERKQTDAAMREALTTLDATEDGAFIFDPETLRFSYVNEGAVRQLGYTRGELLTMTPVDIKPEFTEASFRAMLGPLQKGEIHILHFSTLHRRKNGQDVPVEIALQHVSPPGERARFIAIARDITERKEAERNIWAQANYDTLTGLPNRNMFRDRMQQEIMKSERANSHVALFLIDLDQFKEVNDALGHEVGDLLLKGAAGRIRGSVRESDTVARLGGDEFVVIISPLPGIAFLDEIAQKLIADLAAPYHLGNEIAHVSASIGISLCPSDASDLDSLMKNADQAMYAAKNQGRNRFSYFTPAMQEAAQTRLRIGNDLRLGLDREEFVLYYQPQVHIETGRVVAVEALVRWRHPERGLVPPNLFIPIAEDNGLILPLGEWVMRTACGQLRQWVEQGMMDLRMSINLSVRQFRQVALVESVLKILEDARVAPSSIELEITESLAMDNPQENSVTLRKIRDSGVSVAIDDFGTGHCSLGYLKNFPVNRLKLDRSFIMQIETEPNDAIIVSAAIKLAHDMGMEVVAEGVETDRQLECLTRLDCDIIQGYYFSPPLPAAEAELFIRQHNAQLASVADHAMLGAEILAIDDDELMCDFMVSVLGQVGHRVRAETDPFKGLEALRQNPLRFDLIMVDLLMPGMSGLDLVKAVREINREVPVMIVTSYRADAVRKIFKPVEKEWALIPGINYFVLEKPFLAEGLLKEVRKILLNPSGWIPGRSTEGSAQNTYLPGSVSHGVKQRV